MYFDKDRTLHATRAKGVTSFKGLNSLKSNILIYAFT